MTQGKPKTCKRVGSNIKIFIMKKFRTSLIASSFAIALLAAFAFSPHYNTQKYFRVDANGNRGAEITEPHQCTTSNNNCEYVVTYDAQGHEIGSVLMKGNLQIL
jgi:hypothetical protein